MWYIRQIREADFGCEERMPGEPLMALVELESDDGRQISFEASEEWLDQQELAEGDEWPGDPDDSEENRGPAWVDKCEKQADFMEQYLKEWEELTEQWKSEEQ